MNAVSERPQAEPLAQAEKHDLSPMRDHLADLVARYSDAEVKLSESQDSVLDATRALRIAASAEDYQQRRVKGLRARILTVQAAIRAAENDMLGVFE